MEEQQSPTAGTPIYQESQQKNAKWLWLFIVLIIVGALIYAFVKGIGPFAAFKSEKVQEESTPPPVDFFQSSPSPESSPEAEVDKSQAVIRILNGSGKAGVASSVKDFLESKGYKIGSVGNAENFGFEQTVIRLKDSFKNFREVLFSDLSDNYSVKVSEDNLDATDSADIEIIVGSK
ncbi:hypothetical protein A3F02_01100 [Candidatus Curtissbacteria bacterium RIFCSPHIGHO2_12_FULL_38_9b]|uniref:LytR/CpsA/Psr regulator C-terminal domain-containing protein n=1 Tax=Candidatus Curtissbacteria bacterium RIFCSPHIGHO2_12_FULL_38_9b TaxID=1797720 RepID=A0A1F5GUV2_9BACT|nr:MAG: hypothetical protein A3F02_01100 [Candidatus Curtissbacteria bacterium RIFCSPHIGHO2_12_FULL_38_9b]